jgi:hypothetical protein
MADISLIVKKTGVSREHDQPSTSRLVVVLRLRLYGILKITSSYFSGGIQLPPAER